MIVESGTIGKDGKLRLPMDRLNMFFKANLGKRIIARFEVLEPGTSEAQWGYYHAYILPTVVEALRQMGTLMTESQVETMLLAAYPQTLRTVDGETVTEVAEMNQFQMSGFIEWLKMYAAENLYVYIEDPRTI